MLTSNVKKYIQDHCLVHRRDKIIVGVSGGPDSIALLYILFFLQDELGVELHVAHFNHRLRQSSRKDQKFVEQFCSKLHLPFHTRVANKLLLRKGSIEDVARRHRFHFFIHLAKKIKAQHIALGHTQNDFAETVLLHLLRGSGLQGLRGIMPQRYLEGVSFIRPLLLIRRSEILKFLKNHKLKYCLDPTNQQTKFFRNKIRHKLLPLLQKQYNPNIVNLLANLGNNSALDYDYLIAHAAKIMKSLSKKSRNAISMKLKEFKNQHPAIQRMMMRLSIECLKGNTNRLTLKHILEMEDLIRNRPVNSVVHLPDRIFVRKDKESLTICIRGS